MSLLRAEKLCKSFSGRLVVDDVSFQLEEAEIVGLLGRNGAGKTTSFRMAIGMLNADGGRVVYKDQDITDLPMYQRARRGMGYLSQEPSVFQRMTCEQNLLAILETLDLTKQERKSRAADLLGQFGLAHKARLPARTCSGGERRKLEIARALVTDPRLILLDEPFSGVDPIAVEDLQQEIRSLAKRGIAILITDHNVQQTLRVCGRAYILDGGRVLAEGTPRELINNEMVRRAYLGSLFRGDEFDPISPPASPATSPAASDNGAGAKTKAAGSKRSNKRRGKRGKAKADRRRE
jgi:lipopolysaccharide export system ATP-binding protein